MLDILDLFITLMAWIGLALCAVVAFVILGGVFAYIDDVVSRTRKATRQAEIREAVRAELAATLSPNGDMDAMTRQRINGTLERVS